MQKTKLLKIAVLSSMLVEELDELKGNSFYKHQLKNRGSSFHRELDKFLDKIFDRSTNPLKDSNFIVQISKGIDELIEQNDY